MDLDWQDKSIVAKELTDSRLTVFLFQNGSLSRFIEDNCNGKFHIELKNESWCQALANEINVLSLVDDAITFIRESWLKCDDRRLVYARTVIPQTTFARERRTLQQLGNKPLGNILFSDSTSHQTSRRYAKIPLGCNLHQQATAGSKIASNLWGRQSIFNINNNPLLITEVFLPSILTCTKS